MTRETEIFPPVFEQEGVLPRRDAQELFDWLTKHGADFVCTVEVRNPATRPCREVKLELRPPLKVPGKP